MQSIPIGAAGSFSLLVMPEHLASRFKDVSLPPVLATPAGRTVIGEATVTHVDGRRIEFSIRAVDGNEEIGAGTHERVVIQLAKLSERMKAKFD
jgi:fluoroacetyl-CoA thioesterase